LDTIVQTDGNGLFIEVPDDIVAGLGKGKRPPVRATLNGFSYRTTVAAYGGKSYLGFRKEVREAAGLNANDAVTVLLELDEEPRTVELPG